MSINFIFSSQMIEISNRVFEHIGSRSSMEDCCFHINSPIYQTYVMLDGHGSRQTVDTSTVFIGPYIDQNIYQLTTENYHEWFDDLYQSLEYHLRDMNCKGGTTLTIIIFYKQHLYLGQVGDSQVAIINNDVFYMSPKHNTQDVSECRRIISESNCMIDSEGYIAGMINLTRTLGDFNIKKMCPAITMKPECGCFILDNDVRIFMATDGLWNGREEWPVYLLNSLWDYDITTLNKIFTDISYITKDNTSVMMLDVKPHTSL
jgi:serine/threonine protein phosphatase PrpC